VRHNSLTLVDASGIPAGRYRVQEGDIPRRRTICPCAAMGRPPSSKPAVEPIHGTGLPAQGLNAVYVTRREQPAPDGHVRYPDGEETTSSWKSSPVGPTWMSAETLTARNHPLAGRHHERGDEGATGRFETDSAPQARLGSSRHNCLPYPDSTRSRCLMEFVSPYAPSGADVPHAEIYLESSAGWLRAPGDGRAPVGYDHRQ